MENPFAHNRAINLIGQVLDENEIMIQTGEISFASLEYRIFNRLFNEGCLNEKAMETVGLEGRYPEDIAAKKQVRVDAAAESAKKMQEITDRMKKHVKGLEGIEIVDNG